MAPSPTFGNPLALISSLASLFANQNGGATGGVPGIAAGLLGTGLFPTGAGTSAGLGATGATPRAIPGVRAPAAAGASPFPGYMSPQQQLQLAKQEALAQLQPIIDEYHYQQDQAQKLAAAQSAVAQARGEALANIDSGIAPQIGSNYKQAADSTAGYAKGYGTDLQNTVQSQTDANNATLDKVSGGVGARQTAPNLSDVLFGTMGKLPADTLQAQGAAFKSAADMRPSTDRGLGLQDASSALNQGLVQQGTLAHQLDSYLKQQPGLVSSALARIGKDQQGLYNQDQAAQYRGATLRQADQRLGLDAAAKAAQVKQGQQRLQLDAAKAKLTAQQKQQDAADRRAYHQGRLTIDDYNARVRDRAEQTNEKIANAALGLKAQNQTFQQKATQAKLNQSQQRLSQTDQRLALDTADAKARISLASGNQQLALKRLIVQEKQFEVRATTGEQKQAWSQASADAATKTQSGLIYHVVPDKQGNPVVVPWIVNGKPQITSSLRKQASGGGLSARDRVKQGALAEKGARLAFQGGTVDEKAPTFTISRTDPGGGQGWSEPIEGADGKLIGYRNHYPPTDFATAFQDAVENGVDPTIATQHLVKWFTGSPDRGGPMNKGQRVNAKRLPGQLKRAGIKPSQYVPNSQLPKAEPGR